MSSKNIMSAVSTAFSFTSTKITENLVEYIKREKLEITEDQMRQLSAIVQGSIEQSLSLTSRSIEKAYSE